MTRKAIWETPGEILWQIIAWPKIRWEEKRSMERWQKAQEVKRKVVEAKNDRSALVALLDGKFPCNPQLQSPLFNKIPAEIRAFIFELTLSEADGRTAISPSDYWYRPDYTHYRYIDTRLLLTCRRIWLETYTIPRCKVINQVWLGDVRRRSLRRLVYTPSPAEQALYGNLKNHTITFWPTEVIQVYAQMFALENGQLKSFLEPYPYQLNPYAPAVLKPRKLILTIRYTDWWIWENNQALRIQDGWHTAPLPESIEEVVLELETRFGKRAELEAIVGGQVRQWIWCCVDSQSGTRMKYLLDEKRTKRWDWIGSATPGGLKYQHHKPEFNDEKEPIEEKKMRFYVVRMVWEKAKSEQIRQLE